jgi:4-hydroxythreonine-4-phosphate dehydrogenase
LNVAILADDLSGAADSAVGFARRDVRTELLLGLQAATTGTVVACDLDTRRLGVERACVVAVAGWRWAREREPRWIYKKIDSKLRGHVVDELLALAPLLDPATLVLVCPAHPDAGVSYRDGVPIVAGRATAPEAGGRTLAQLGHAWRARGLPVLAAADAMTLSSQACVSRLAHAGVVPAATLALVDAQQVEELVALVAALATASRPVLLVGSGGLTGALAAHLHPDAVRPLRQPQHALRTLVIAGSNAALTRRQLEHVAHHAAVPVHSIAPGGRGSRLLPATLCSPFVIALGGSENSRGPHSAAVLEAFVDACLPHARQSDALVLTGGETARSVLVRLGVHALDIEGELEPGVVLARARGAWHGIVVTKSGSFGREDALFRTLQFLGGTACR